MSKSSILKSQALIKEAKEYLDFSELFPQSKIDARRPLTKYQKEKIKSTLKELYSAAGGKEFLEKTFVPVKKSKSRALLNDTASLPKAFRGVILPGGKKANKNVRVRRGEVIFDRGEAKNLRFKPLKAKTERGLLKNIKQLWPGIVKSSDFISLGTYSGEIKYIYTPETESTEPNKARIKSGEHDALDRFLQATAYLYNKYAALAGEKRINRFGKDKGVYAHPSKWGLGLWIH